MTQYNIALIGFGGVNRALAQLVADNNERWDAELGLRLNSVAVTDLHFGSVISPNGIDARMQLSGGSAEAGNERVIRHAPRGHCGTAELTVNDAIAAGATLLCGPRREGNVYHPTVLEGVLQSCELWMEEVFAPVVSVVSNMAAWAERVSALPTRS
jgi:hypothetical protein